MLYHYWKERAWSVSNASGKPSWNTWDAAEWIVGGKADCILEYIRDGNIYILVTLRFRVDTIGTLVCILFLYKKVPTARIHRDRKWFTDYRENIHEKRNWLFVPGHKTDGWYRCKDVDVCEECVDGLNHYHHQDIKQTVGRDVKMVMSVKNALMGWYRCKDGDVCEECVDGLNHYHHQDSLENFVLHADVKSSNRIHCDCWWHVFAESPQTLLYHYKKCKITPYVNSV